MKKKKLTRDDILIIVMCTATFLVFVLPNIINLLKK